MSESPHPADLMINAILTDSDECWIKLTMLAMFRRELAFRFSASELKRVLVSQIGPGAVPQKVDMLTPGKPRRPRRFVSSETPPPEIAMLLKRVEVFCETDIEFRNIVRAFGCYRFDVVFVVDGDNLISYKLAEV